MPRVFNFNAGPSMLPLPVLETLRDSWFDFGHGRSLLEMSHRDPAYTAVHRAAVDGIRDLLDLPPTHHVLLLAGGATLQFAMVPLNLLAPGRSCDFVVGGYWARRALADTRRVGRVNVLWDGTETGVHDLPDPTALPVSPGAAYLHFTSNETIDGVQWPAWPETGDVPLVGDMSSDILSRPIPAERFGLIYASAQKNLGPAGVSVVIVREDLLDRIPDTLPSYLDYRRHAGKDAPYGTPPVFAVYGVKLVTDRLREIGGIDAAERLAAERSRLVYGAIDAHAGFYRCTVPARVRSRMNVVFRLPTEALEEAFVAEAESAGLVGLRGHRSAGGCRASMYNAMPLEGAAALAAFMSDFVRRKG